MACFADPLHSHSQVCRFASALAGGTAARRAPTVAVRKQDDLSGGEIAGVALAAAAAAAVVAVCACLFISRRCAPCMTAADGGTPKEAAQYRRDVDRRRAAMLHERRSRRRLGAPAAAAATARVSVVVDESKEFPEPPLALRSSGNGSHFASFPAAAGSYPYDGAAPDSYSLQMPSMLPVYSGQPEAAHGVVVATCVVRTAAPSAQ